MTTPPPSGEKFFEPTPVHAEAQVAIENLSEDSVQRESSIISSGSNSSSQSIINQLQDHNIMLQEQNVTLTNTVASFLAVQANKDKEHQIRDEQTEVTLQQYAMTVKSLQSALRDAQQNHIRITRTPSEMEEESNVTEPFQDDSFLLSTDKVKVKNLSDEEKRHDDTIILGLERTFFAALNNAWLLAIGGIGLMSVGTNEDATSFGIIVLSTGITSAIAAYVMHLYRVKMLESGVAFHKIHSRLWISLVICFTVVTLSVELHYGILYPYLDREKAVTIANGEDDLVL